MQNQPIRKALSPWATSVAVTAGLSFVAHVVKFLNSRQDGSLTSFTKSTRVEPITLVDEQLRNYSFMPDVMQTLASIFTGYYLRAVSIVSNVNSAQVLRRLDVINPDRDSGAAFQHGMVGLMNSAPMQAAGGIPGAISHFSKTGSTASSESYEYGLPVPNQTTGLESFGVTMESIDPNANKKPFEYDDKGAPKSSLRDAVAGGIDKLVAETDAKVLDHGALAAGLKGVAFGGGSGASAAVGNVKDAQQTVYEAHNLAVGKLVEVEVGEGGNKARFQIMVRLLAVAMRSDVLAHILGDGNRNNSFKERFRMWKAGVLDGWRDLVLCQDLIDQHRRALMKDETGVYSEILERRSRNSFSGFMTGTPSVATASNLVVLSKSTARKLEQSIGGHLSDHRLRDRLFKNTYIMILVVVDPESEQVLFYHRDIDLPTHLSIREIKGNNRGSGPDVGEILKAYQLGQTPSASAF